MSGLQEILVIVLIVLALWAVPRLTGRSRGYAAGQPVRRFSLQGRTRLAILASAVWVAAAGLVLNPLEGPVLPFVLAGPGPVALGWGAAWVMRGYGKGR